jgi:PmbA protein
MIDAAVETSRFGEVSNYRFPSERAESIVDTCDNNARNLTLDDYIDKGKYFMDKAKKHRESCDMSFSASGGFGEFAIMNTSGLDIREESSNVSFSFSLVRVKEGDVFMVGDYIGSRGLPPDFEQKLDGMMVKYDEQLRLADTVLKISSGKIPIIFDPQGTMVLLLPFLTVINGEHIHTGARPIAHSTGEQIFDSRLSIYDDATNTEGLSCGTYDEEGIPKKRLALVEDGVLKSFLFDLTTAGKANTKSNGCAQRSIFSPPSPSTSNIMVNAGDIPFSKMIEDIKEGLLIEGVLGMGQGNIISGAFSNPVSTAFKIENGRLTGRVKEAQIAANIYDVLKNITAIGDKPEWIWGSYNLPHIRMDNIPVVAK